MSQVIRNPQMIYYWSGTAAQMVMYFEESKDKYIPCPKGVLKSAETFFTQAYRGALKYKTRPTDVPDVESFRIARNILIRVHGKELSDPEIITIFENHLDTLLNIRVNNCPSIVELEKFFRELMAQASAHSSHFCSMDE